MRPTPRVPRRHPRRLKSPKALRRENRADRSVRRGAMSLAIHRPAPGRNSVAGARSARSECRKPAEPGARSSRPVTYGTSGTAPWRGAREARPEGACPERRPLPAGAGRLAVVILPPRRVQVSRWRALSAGRAGQRPPAPPGSATLGVASPGGKTFRQRVSNGRKANPARRCFRRPLRSRATSELLGIICTASEKSI